MTPEQFCYWMQGFVEMNQENDTITEKQWLIIKDHLKTVFTKVTPDRNISKKLESPLDDQLSEIMERIKELQKKDAINIPYHPPNPQPWAEKYPHYQPMPVWCGDKENPPTVIC